MAIMVMSYQKVLKTLCLLLNGVLMNIFNIIY